MEMTYHGCLGRELLDGCHVEEAQFGILLLVDPGLAKPIIRHLQQRGPGRAPTQQDVIGDEVDRRHRVRLRIVRAHVLDIR